MNISKTLLKFLMFELLILLAGFTLCLAPALAENWTAEKAAQYIPALGAPGYWLDGKWVNGKITEPEQEMFIWTVSLQTKVKVSDLRNAVMKRNELFANGQISSQDVFDIHVKQTPNMVLGQSSNSSIPTSSQIPAGAQSIYSSVTSGSSTGTGDNKDSNKGTPYDIRANYWKRYPFAAAAAKADILVPVGDGTPKKRSLGTSPLNPNLTEGQRFPVLAYTPVITPQYQQPLLVAMDVPATYRDLELFETALPMAVFGLPLSDTQFQILDRENKQRFLELFFDPERFMWLATNTGQIGGAAASNSIAGAAQSTFNNAFDSITGGMKGAGLGGTGGGASGGTLINIANENAASSSPSSGVAYAIYKVQRMYALVFVPMAILFLLPGAVLTQTKSLVTRGILGTAGEDASSPFEGILRAIVAIFLIPATQLIVSYSIDIGNSMAGSVTPWIGKQALLGWSGEQMYHPPPQNVKNAIMAGSSTSGGLLGGLGGLGSIASGLAGGSSLSNIGSALSNPGSLISGAIPGIPSAGSLISGAVPGIPSAGSLISGAVPGIPSAGSLISGAVPGIPSAGSLISGAVPGIPSAGSLISGAVPGIPSAGSLISGAVPGIPSAGSLISGAVPGIPSAGSLISGAVPGIPSAGSLISGAVPGIPLAGGIAGSSLPFQVNTGLGAAANSFVNGVLGNLFGQALSSLGLNTAGGVGLNGQGGEGKAAQVPSQSTIQESQLWLSQIMELGFNFFSYIFGLMIIVLTSYQLVFMCYLYLLGPLSACFFAWPSVGGPLFKGVFGDWLNAVITLSLWRFYWCVILAIMTQRLIYLQTQVASGFNPNAQFEMMVFVCFLGLMLYVPFAPFTFDPGMAVMAVLNKGTALGHSVIEGAGSAAKAAGAPAAAVDKITQQATGVLAPMESLGRGMADAEMSAAMQGGGVRQGGAPGGAPGAPVSAGFDPSAINPAGTMPNAGGVTGTAPPNASPPPFASGVPTTSPSSNVSLPPSQSAAPSPLSFAPPAMMNVANQLGADKVANIPPGQAPVVPSVPTDTKAFVNTGNASTASQSLPIAMNLANQVNQQFGPPSSPGSAGTIAPAIPSTSSAPPVTDVASNSSPPSGPSSPPPNSGSPPPSGPASA